MSRDGPRPCSAAATVPTQPGLGGAGGELAVQQSPRLPGCTAQLGKMEQATDALQAPGKCVPDLRRGLPGRPAIRL